MTRFELVFLQLTVTELLLSIVLKEGGTTEPIEKALLMHMKELNAMVPTE